MVLQLMTPDGERFYLPSQYQADASGVMRFTGDPLPPCDKANLLADSDGSPTLYYLCNMPSEIAKSYPQDAIPGGLRSQKWEGGANVLV